MKKYIQHEFLKISNFSTKVWEHPLHSHNHFEIIYIHSGKGSHCLSGTHQPYGPSSLFFISPNDIHSFIIDEETEFTFLKFTNVYFKNIENIPAASNWNQDIDELLVYASRSASFTPKTTAIAKKTGQLIRLIVTEWQETKDENSKVIFLLMSALLVYIKASAVYLEMKPRGQHSGKIAELINYIHEHIYCVANIQANHLADKFGYSKHYLGIYFKEHTGCTLTDYISQYKLHLIVNRLQYSSFTIKEISNEFGFTDLSHFNKFFKKHKGINPTAFREKVNL